MIESDPALYHAVPIGELIRLLKSDFEQSAQTLLQQLQAPSQASYSFYSWQGAEPIKTAIRRLIANADKTIVVDIWVEPYLLEAEQRGITVTLISIGESPSALQHVLVHKRSEEWKNVSPRKFSLLIDARAALLGSLGHTIKSTLLESDHPSM